MRLGIEVRGVDAAMRGFEDDLAEINTAAVRENSEIIKAEWQEQIIRAGLGRRLARTIKVRVYPVGGESLDAAGFIYTKAPKIIGAFAEGPTITPKDGRRALAIPTKNVPLKGRGRPMTPLDVEVSFNQDLILRPGRKGVVLGFVNVIQAKNKKGWRQATPRRLAQGRAAKLVLMFVFVRKVHLRKRLDLDALTRRAGDRHSALLTKHWR